MRAESQSRALTGGLPQGVRQVEGREWWLWGFATAVTLGLTFGIVSLAFRGSEPTGSAVYFQTLREWVRGLAALVLLFDVYTIHQHLQLERIRRRLSQREQLFHVITESAADMIAVVGRDGRRLYNSPSYEKILGYTPEELRDSSCMEQVHPADRPRVLQAAERAYVTGEGECLEYRIRHKDGSWRILESRSSVMHSRTGRPEQLVIVSRDVTARKQAEALLEHRALHDELTNLPNRPLFLDRLQRAIGVSQRHPDFKFAVFLIDIDEFKVLNDSLGYSAGNELLIQIARRLTSSLRCTDTVSHRRSPVPDSPATDDTLARPGGDEFAILAAELRHPSDAIRMSSRLQQRIAAPFAVNGQEIRVTASIGVVFSGDAVHSAEDVLRNAEIAMYRAKRAGKACCEVFDSEMQAQAVKRLQLETDLRRAVEHREFVVYYQPIVCLKTREVVALEALSRWQRSSGMVMPSEFIPVAEETGIILTINQQLLYESCEQVRRWQVRFPSKPPLCLCVNITARQFAQADLASQIGDALQKTEMDPDSVDIEITEGIAMLDADRSAAVLSQLNALGVHVSIDDFGTGYSSLSRLHRFPVDTLKIDRTFIAGVNSDHESREIVRVIILLAHNLGLKVVAEGIETREQMKILDQLGCEYGQGYLFSPPADSVCVDKLLGAPVLPLQPYSSWLSAPGAEVSRKEDQ
jgi:PAS domain S-box-containing protein